jgi:hypothetical protein
VKVVRGGMMSNISMDSTCADRVKSLLGGHANVQPI